MAALRVMINEHEKTVLKQISTVRSEESQRLKDYKAGLKWQTYQWDEQKEKLERLRIDGIDVMRSEAEFQASMANINQALEGMQIPRRNFYHIQGIDQMEKVKKKIAQWGRYVPYSNPEVEEHIADSAGQSKLELNDMCLDLEDVDIVAHTVRSSKVSKGA